MFPQTKIIILKQLNKNNRNIISSSLWKMLINMEEVTFPLYNMRFSPMRLSELTKHFHLFLTCSFTVLHVCRSFIINHNTLNYPQKKCQEQEERTTNKNSGGVMKNWIQTLTLIICCNNVTLMSNVFH